ncbi:hypothetical protein [Ferrimonas kyonanensis]|uniref:hypothetical protein n=1 Tax=Ferrimonas kyonanensis TaxID=364763 RepID=UPI000405BFD7|nr:hypothetical protein [Ferrimonas kyonanensis]
MALENCVLHFPVGNGDMTLLQIGRQGFGKTVLVDVKITDSSQGEQAKCDVLAELHSVLPKRDGVPYIDCFVATHPDDDHVKGLKKHFYLGPPEEYQKREEGIPLIKVDEIWFSEVCTKRISEDRRLGEDAVALRTEVKRRRKCFESKVGAALNGNRLLVLGSVEDGEGKVERWDLPGLVAECGSTITIGEAEALVLAPLGDEIFDDENQSSKNDSSVVIRWTIKGSRILLGGDATVHIWKSIGDKYTAADLSYDLLLAPHHCSWRTISYDSASKTENPKVNEGAIAALSHAEPGALIVSSSKEISSVTQDPPSHLAKAEYEKVVGAKKFLCLADTGNSQNPPKVRQVNLGYMGVSLVAVSAPSIAIPKKSQPIRHG